MAHDAPRHEHPELVDETRRIWDANANWWDDRIGDGNSFQDHLIEPASENLLAVRPGQEILDIACGAGRFTRRIAALGARVVAFDQSEKFIERARARTVEQRDRIDYRVMNATDEAALLSLGEGRFDAAVCTMAIMDMAQIEPLLAALSRLLKADGRFVFSITHPAFNSTGSRLLAMERVSESGRHSNAFGVWVSDYLTPGARKGEGIPGQPEPQYYFHRPISLLLNLCFKAGFVLDGFEEPALPPGTKGSMPLNWSYYQAIPPVLVVRCRLSLP